MQNQKKQLFILCGVLIICVAVLLLWRFYGKQQEEAEAAKQEAEKITILQLPTEDITAFSYEKDGETLSFSKEEDVWLYDGDKTLTLGESVIETMLSAVEDFSAEEQITDYENLSDYGLETPQNTITFQTKEQEYILYLGNENEMLSEYYVKLEGSGTVYLVSTSINTVFQKDVEDLIAEEEEE